MQHALGFAGGARGIEDEQRIFRAHFFGRTFGRLLRGSARPIQIAALDKAEVRTRAAQHDDGIDAGAVLQRLVHVGLQRHLAAPAQALVSGEYHAAVAIADAACQSIGAEACKHDRMDCADAGAGEHRHGGFRHHRQIDRHPLAAFHAARFKQVGKAADVFMQLAISDLAVRLARAIGLPQDRDVIAACGQMAVKAIGRKVQRAILEPADAEVRLMERGVLDLGVWLDPIKPLAVFGPERLRILNRLAIHRKVARLVHQRIGRPLRRNRINCIAHVRLSQKRIHPFSRILSPCHRANTSFQGTIGAVPREAHKEI